MNTVDDVMNNHVEMLQNIEAVKGEGYALTTADLMNICQFSAGLQHVGVPSELEMPLREFMFRLVFDLSKARGLTTEQVREAAGDAARLADQFNAHMRAAV